ncbi:probable serine/threonine-protein kinase DDB_G0282963 isoform X2 [Contarinia nasturtii]|uniref:probable serine/threonine-protein kinase DDB_G0282963 isoform X2 n=1 Tax=Contarinia nasturtii TaxID=265458 RepID=UPI0012D43A1D|nr:probable serine/threonine-protein kinase DDB_G0282963 isoform X2 [Contarinia nasturtii]
MKRQKLKVFNSNHHSGTMNCVSVNKLFTVLFNRRAILGIALLSTLLPLNQAAPTATLSSYTNGIEIETTSQSSSPVMPPTTTKFILNGTFQMDKINDKLVSPLVDNSASSTMEAATATTPTTIEKTPTNDKAASIEYNHNVAATTINSDSVRVTTTFAVSSSNNYLDKNNDSILPINILKTDSQRPDPTTIDDKYINGESTVVLSTSTTTTESSTGQNEDLVTTTTFIPNRYSSANDLSDSIRSEGNKNPTQETIFTTENSVQTPKSTLSSIFPDSITLSSKSSTGYGSGGSDVTTQTSKTASSLTEIDDELSFNVNVEKHFNGQENVQSETGNPLSTAANIQTNDNAKDGTHENSKSFETAINSELGQSTVTTKPTSLNKSASTTVSSGNGIATSKNVGKIAKVFDEEKLSSKKAKHDSIGNNNKKYNNKNNKDKSKKKANEEGGVNDPNGKLNDNLLMEAISSTQEPPPPSPPEPMASSFATDVRSAVFQQTTTISSIESHSNDGHTFVDKVPNSKAFNEIRTESVINADVTNFTPTTIVATDTHISSTLNVQDVVSSTTTITPTTTSETSTKTEFVQVESTVQKHDTVDQTITSTTFKPETPQTKEPISDATLLNEKPMTTEKTTTVATVEVTTEHNDNNSYKHSNVNVDGMEMNKTDNQFEENNRKTSQKPKIGSPSILDYDKSSEEIFDIVRETSTPKTSETSFILAEKPRSHNTASNNDEFFLPADDLDTDSSVRSTFASSSAITTSATTTTIQSTIPINTESAIVRPNTDGLGPTITMPIPIVTSDTKQQTTDINKASTISRDSDTIFYISNTEVKVVESSVPTPNSKQENQFFPALFEEDVIIDFPGKNSTGWNSGLDGPGDKYEEDIILSPMKSNFDPTKLNDENLSISYVGESFIDIKEATSDDTNVGSDSNAQSNDISSESKENGRSFGENGISSNVIIEPVIIPDIQQPIGVPIIAELPSQINIRDLDYKNDGNIQLNNSGNSISSQFLTHHGDNLQKAHELTAELPKTDSEEATALIDDDKLDLAKNETQKTNTTSAAEAITNVTAFTILDDDPETNWNDIQTIIMIAVLTIVPAIACLILICAIRKVYRKAISLRDGNSSGTNGNVLLRDDSTGPLAMNSHTISADELKSVDCEANSINHSNDNLISNAEITSIQCDEVAGGGQNHHSGANGSLITMTMKNNHLIVETEERSDIARDVRETKVHYSPSEKDGVFVVEVARGADSNTTPIMVNVAAAAAASGGGESGKMTVEQMTVSPRQTQATIVEVPEEQPKCMDYASSNNGNVSFTQSNEKVLVHPPPNGMCMEEDVLMIDEDGAVSMSSPKHNGHDEIEAETSTAAGGNDVFVGVGNINTGLSQSDLSISSSDGSNRAYCYGTQETYTVESTSPHRNGNSIMSIEPNVTTPEPITVISDTEHENQINKNGSVADTLYATLEPVSIDIANENQISVTDNGIILSKALKTTAETENENGNDTSPQHQQRYQHDTEYIPKQNGIKTNGNGVVNGGGVDLKNGINGNGEHLTNDSNDFDSLVNFPAPPTCDEINDITQLDNGNMDSLPPPPPEIQQIPTAGPINVES